MNILAVMFNIAFLKGRIHGACAKVNSWGQNRDLGHLPTEPIC